MKSPDDRIEQLLSEYLRPRETPPSAATWQRIQRAVAADVPMALRRPLLSAGVVLAALCLLGLATAVAASTDLRDYLSGRAVMRGGQIRDGRLASLFPLSSFTVF